MNSELGCEPNIYISNVGTTDLTHNYLLIVWRIIRGIDMPKTLEQHADGVLYILTTIQQCFF